MNDTSDSILKEQIDNTIPTLQKALECKDREILLALLESYATDLRHYSTQIWTIGAVIIPLSLSGVVIALDDPIKTCLIALFSVMLIWIWYFLSVRLRVIVDRSMLIYVAIESQLLELGKDNQSVSLYMIAPLSKGRLSLRTTRLLVVVAVTFVWIVATVVDFLT